MPAMSRPDCGGDLRTRATSQHRSGIQTLKAHVCCRLRMPRTVVDADVLRRSGAAGCIRRSAHGDGHRGRLAERGRQRSQHGEGAARCYHAGSLAAQLPQGGSKGVRSAGKRVRGAERRQPSVGECNPVSACVGASSRPIPIGSGKAGMGSGLRAPAKSAAVEPTRARDAAGPRARTGVAEARGRRIVERISGGRTAARSSEQQQAAVVAVRPRARRACGAA